MDTLREELKETVYDVYQICNEIINTSGKKDKEALLKKYESNMAFREALVFLLNPYIVTGVSTKKINKDISNKGIIVKGFIPTFSKLMSHVQRFNSGRDVDIKLIQNYINTHEDEDVKMFIKKFITKDLKLGISEKTVNKVYGKDTIPSFAVMLAESFTKKGDKIEGKFYVTLKLDGNRCVAVVNREGVKFFSRKGQPIEGMTELTEEFNKLPSGVYDGELLLVNKDNLPSDELFRATQKVIRKDGEKKDLEFYIFDTLTESEFKDGKSARTYEQRRNQLDMLMDIVECNHVLPYEDICPHIKVLPVLYAGEDKSVIPVLVKGVEAQGLEGVMINTADGYYQAKRTTDLQKVKTMQTADLLVVNIEKAIDGQFEGLLGRVNVEYKGNLVGVGSGFTIEDREAFAKNPDLICGKVIEVQFFGESEDEKTGQPSLRFPVYKGIRYDKGVDDINYGD